MKQAEAERAIKAIAKLTDYTIGSDGRLRAFLWIGELSRAVDRGDTASQERLYAEASRHPGEF